MQSVKNTKPLSLRIIKKVVTALIGLSMAAACMPQNVPNPVKPTETPTPLIIENVPTEPVETPQPAPPLFPVGSDPNETVIVPTPDSISEIKKNNIQPLVAIDQIETLLGTAFDISQLQKQFPEAALTAFGATNGETGDNLRYTILIFDSKTQQLLIPKLIAGKKSAYPSIFEYTDEGTFVPVMKEEVLYGFEETAGLEFIQISWNGHHPSVFQNVYDKNGDILFAEILDGPQWRQNKNYFDSKYDSYLTSHQMSFKIENGILFAVREKFYENEPDEYTNVFAFNEDTKTFDVYVPETIPLINGTECDIDTIYSMAADREVGTEQRKIIYQRMMDDPDNPMMQYARNQTNTIDRIGGPLGIYEPSGLYYIADSILARASVGDATPGILRIEGLSFPNYLVLILPTVKSDYNQESRIQIVFLFSDEVSQLNAVKEFINDPEKTDNYKDYYPRESEYIKNIGEDNVKNVRVWFSIYSGQISSLSKSPELAALFDRLNQEFPEWRQAVEYYFGTIDVQRQKDPIKDEIAREFLEIYPLLPTDVLYSVINE